MKILVFTKNWFGDSIFSEPLLRLLKRNYPLSKIYCAAPPRCEDILRSIPYVDHFMAFDEKGIHRSWFKRGMFFMDLRRQAFDRAYLLHKSKTRQLLCRLAGIPERIGFEREDKGGYLTKSIHLENGLHDASNFTRLESRIPKGFDDRYIFYFTDDDALDAKIVLRQKQLKSKQFVCINPGANWEPKRWSPENYAKLADRIHETYKMPVLVTGSFKDRKLAEKIKKHSLHAVIPHTCGETRLGQLAAIFEQSALVVTADTGPMHIASGVGANVIALFGPTDEVATGPYGVGHYDVIISRPPNVSIPCFDDKCDYMKQLTVDEVFEKLKKYLFRA